MLTNSEIRSEFSSNYKYAHDYWQPFVENAQVFTMAASGRTWSNNELQQLAKEGREPLEFNIMRRPLQFFSGYLRDNLNSIVIAPVEGSDQKTADQFTKLSYYTWDKGDGYNVFLDAADECMKSGISLCGIQMDYSRDFINGEISFYKRTYNSFFLDPTFERIDLQDCSFAITRDLLDRSLIKQLLPFVDSKEIDNIHMGFRDDKFLSYHPNFNVLSRNRNLLAYDQYYKRISKRRKFLVDEESSYFRDITDLDKDDIEKLKLGIYRLRNLREEASASGDVSGSQLPPIVEIREVDREFVELNILLNGQHVYSGEDKTGINQTYPFAPLICYMEPSIWSPTQRIQGIGSILYSTQRQFNKRHMKIIDMMDSTISTGFKYLLGTVPDPQEMQQSGQSRLIGVDPENNPAGLGAVEQLRGAEANQSLFDYQNVLDQLTLTLANVNESVLGVDEKGNTQVSGRLAQVRIAQGLRSNRKLFDGLEYSQKILGSLVLKAIQNHYPSGKVKRILGEDPTEQFYEQEFEQYDAVIKEGVRSQSQRDAYYYELVNLKREGIVDVPQDEIVRALQMAGISDLEEAIKKQMQAAQESKKQEAVAQNAQLSVMEATVMEKLAGAKEKESKVATNISIISEKESKAESDKAQATLDRAKAITEIAAMSENRILKVLEYLNFMDEQEAARNASEKVQREDQAAEVINQGSNPQPVQPQESYGVNEPTNEGYTWQT